MRLLIFGLGFCGEAAAMLAVAAGWQVTATSRNPGPSPVPGVSLVGFDSAADALATATHLLVTAPPRDGGDPVLAHYGAQIEEAPGLAWIGYLSTTGVYGDRGGAWVDEASVPAPTAERSVRRLAAETAWRDAAAGRPLDLFRLAGIYGPGRSAIDDLRAGHMRRVSKPGHKFGRIHVGDIAEGVMAAIARPPQGTRVLNFSDDVPAESAVVTAEAARLLGMVLPPPVDFAAASPGMSEMARSFWAENRRVASAATQAALGRSWRYPSYREGLAAIMTVDRDQMPARPGLPAAP